LEENTTDAFVFSDQKEEEYNAILKAVESSESTTVVNVDDDDEEIDIDDI
jgi:hypothetical protein